MGLNAMKKITIEEKVNRVLSDFGYDNSFGTYVNVTKAATHFGINVGESSRLPPSSDGFIIVSEDKKCIVIGVNPNRSFEDKRFIVAHELAYFFLYYMNADLKSAIIHRKNKDVKASNEANANYFADCLLMPKESFKIQYENLKLYGYSSYDTVRKLQEIFQVPWECIERRIKEVASI